MTRLSFAALIAATFAAPALAEIKIGDPYARASGPMAKAGAAFMMIENTGTEDDRLVSAESPAAARVELHTHTEVDGVMRMTEVEEGFVVPAGGMAMLERGGMHVMFMGLTEGWKQGDMVPVTLTFEKAGEMMLDIPVDLERKPKHGAHGGHGDHSGHGNDS
jgi:copper(I)-binding protein